MSWLPMNWIETELSNIAAWGSGGTPSRSNPEYYGGSIPWIKTGELGQRVVLGTEEKITELGLKNSSAKIFPKGSVAVAMYGATIGKTSILGIDASTNQACGIGIPFDGVSTSEYLYYYLASQKDAFIEAGKGGAQPNISQAVIKTWPIPLAPLPEQKRIADKLDTVLARVDACRERLNRVPLILKRFRQSVLAAATSGRLTADWRKQNDGWVDERNSTIAYDAKYNLRAGCEQSVLPNGWVKETLGKVIHLDLGYAFKSADFQKKGMRLLRGDNIEPGKLRWNEPAFYDPSRLGGCQHLLLNAGDIVLAMDRPIITNGLKIARVHADDVPCVLVQRVCRFIPTDRISADYLYQTLCDNAFIGYLQGAQNGTQIPHISGKQILSFEVPIPPVAEQHEIVRRVETLFAFADRLEARLTTARTATDRLTPALLAKAFRGELVPQDPNDEPAAELLKHLAAARAAMSDKPRRGRAAKVEKRPSGHPSPACDS